MSEEVAFEKAAVLGHYDAVQRMLADPGLDVCGGASRGVKALELAAGTDQVEVMQLLAEAGVRDTGSALASAIIVAKRNSINFLLKQYERDSLDHVNKGSGPTLLICAIRNYKYKFAPKLVRWLLDSGASTTRIVTMVDADGIQVHRGTARACMRFEKATQVVGGNGGKLEAIGRLLKQEDAVHAISWVWPRIEEAIPTTTTTMVLPLVRRSREATSRVALRGILRYSKKTD